MTEGIEVTMGQHMVTQLVLWVFLSPLSFCHIHSHSPKLVRPQGGNSVLSCNDPSWVVQFLDGTTSRGVIQS